VSNDPINFIDLWGLSEIIAGNIVYNPYNDSYRDLQSGSIKNKTTIDITRPAGHTSGHYKSTLDVNVKSSDGTTVTLYSNPVQSWADKADPNDPTEYTAPAGTYEGRLYGSTGSYSNPIGLVNETLGVEEDHNVLIHGNEITNPSSDRYGDSWVNTGSSEACQITQGQATRYNELVSTLKSAGYNFGNGYKDYSDTITVNINDPANITTTRDGKEIDTRCND
jgi:hypothetical protein